MTDGHDFERKVLPFLRVFWPGMGQVPSKKSWDRRGVDLLEWSEGSRFPCVVQCKGFEVQDLGASQLLQVENSVEKFAQSDVSADTYLLVHNRDGRNQSFNEGVNEKLRGLVSSGRVARAELWDRQTLLNRCCDRIEEILSVRLRDHARYLLNHFQQLFEFGRFYLPEIPVVESKLAFRRGAPCSIDLVVACASRDICRILLSPVKARWTLVTGTFGTGKTTSVLHAATSSERVILLVPCVLLSVSSLRHSTNVVLEEVVNVMGILSQFGEHDKKILDEFGGAILHRLLKDKDSPYLLVLDGLDENGAFSDLHGLQQLSNQLADLTCPIIMTTRKEHFAAMFGDFSFAFDEFSTKLGPHRHARLLELEHWSAEQVLKLVDEVSEKAPDAERLHFREFRRLLETGEFISLYGQMPFHPLFLQFILEDISERGPRPTLRSALIRQWVERKIRRDRKSWAPDSVVTRPLPDETIDLADFVDRMIQLMEKTAFLMTRSAGQTVELSESIDWASLQREAKCFFATVHDPLLAILLNSMLIAQSHRIGMDFRVTFALRVFHEYFLASYLVKAGLEDSGFPAPVRSFCLEIKQSARDS